MITIENLCFSYGKTQILTNVSSQFEEGKIYGLLGRNGVGKTTLLSLLAGAQEAKEGMILFNGKPLFENQDAISAIGLFYQRNDLDREMDHSKVEDLFKKAKQFRKHFDLDYANELAQKFNLKTSKRMNKLSKGNEAVIQAILGLASRVPVTIFDEVYLGMDAPSRTLFYSELLDEQERFPRMFIVSTHLVSEMEHLFDEVKILENGQFSLDESYQTAVEKGNTLTGDAEAVSNVTKGLKVIREQVLGPTKAVSVFGELGEQVREQCVKQNIAISQMPLQDLFIALTAERG
ncbi:ABC transporter ATP-binding protein [Bacillus sp. JCM 19047]|nr:ABC transporter ATP-binding protein [Bacillus sp. JCM 19047]